MKQWLRRWLYRNREEADLTDELAAHLEIEKRLRREAGQTAVEAEHDARRAFGNLAKFREDARETWGLTPVERFLDDMRFGLRMLRRTPVWTTVICATLALGIGIGTAVFSVAYGVLLQPLPYPQPDRLMALWPSTRGTPRFNVNAVLWLRWRRDSKLFEDIALTRPIANFNLTGDRAPERLQGARCTFNLPIVLGLRPQFGRMFTEDEQRGDARVALLSHRFWIRRFGGDPTVVNRKIQLNGEPWTVLGVMPEEFRYPNSDFELWTPLFIPPQEIRDGMNHQYIAVGRIRPGVSGNQVQAEISAIMHRLAEENPAIYRPDGQALGALVEPLARSDAFQVRGTLYALLAAMGSLLLIGCLNLSVLLIARAAARSREMAVRAALGANAGRLRRQVLAEILPLSLAGALGGIVASHWLLRALLFYLPANTPRADSVGLNGPVLAFALGISLLVVLLAALVPARLAARGNPALALGQSSRSVTGGTRTRTILVVAQMALACTLLYGGLLFARSLASLLAVNPGFSTTGTLTLHLAVTRAKYPKDPQVAEYYRRLAERVQAVPGVLAAGFVNRLPLSGIAQTGAVEFDGRAGLFDSDWRSATPGYFTAVGIRLLQGRALTDSDRPDSPPVGLIDERMAREVFGSANPVGHRFRRRLPPGLEDPWSEIVGVVRHVHNEDLEKDPRAQVYWPETQRTQDRAAMVVRTAGNPETFAHAVVDAIHREDPDQPVYDIRSMDQWLARTLQSRNLLTGLVSLFAGASLLLACLGLYGVVSYTSNLRLREFGIRMALGAATGDIRRLILGGAARLALLGCAFGLALAWPAGRFAGSLLFGVGGNDPVSWAAAPVALMGVALLASLVPARTASTTAPAVTLRAE